MKDNDFTQGAKLPKLLRFMVPVLPVMLLQRFAGGSLFLIGLATLGATLLEKYLTEQKLWNEYLVTGINMAINLVTEFTYQRFVVFRKSIDTNSLAAKDEN